MEGGEGFCVEGLEGRHGAGFGGGGVDFHGGGGEFGCEAAFFGWRHGGEVVGDR